MDELSIEFNNYIEEFKKLDISKMKYLMSSGKSRPCIHHRYDRLSRDQASFP